jgi:hypothetical protein
MQQFASPVPATAVPPPSRAIGHCPGIPATRPEFPNTPIVVGELAVVLTAENAAAFDAVKRFDIHGDEDTAAVRELLFSWREDCFLRAHGGAPAIDAQ